MLTINDFAVSDRVAHITMGAGTVNAKGADCVYVIYDRKIERGAKAGRPTEGQYNARWFELCPNYLMKGEVHPQSNPSGADVAMGWRMENGCLVKEYA